LKAVAASEAGAKKNNISILCADSTNGGKLASTLIASTTRAINSPVYLN